MATSYYEDYLLSEKVITAPWPQDAVLYQPYETEQILLAENASCLAVKAYLRMCNLPIEVKTKANAEFMSPGGRMTKLPLLKVGDFVLSEFDPIISFVEQKKMGLNNPLNDDQLSDMRCYICLVENIFTMAELYMTFVDEKIFQTVTTPRIRCGFPWPLNALQVYLKKRNAIKLLKTYQWHQMSIDEVTNKVEKCCESLTALLHENNSPFFYSKSPCALDAIVFGHLFSILTTDLPNSTLAETIGKFEQLIRFCTTVHQTYFPEKLSEPSNTAIENKIKKI